MTRIKTVIFDLDGTLIKCHIDFPRLKRDLLSFFRKQGVPSSELSPTQFTYEIVDKAYGILRDQAYPEAKLRRVRKQVSDIMDMHELRSSGNVEESPGASDTLQMLKHRGIRVGIITRACRSYAEDALRRSGLLQYVEALVCRDDVVNPKPNVDSLLKVLDGFNVHPDEAVYVGDSIVDMRFASEAKVPFIAVVTGMDSERRFVNQKCGRIIHSIRQLPQALDLE